MDAETEIFITDYLKKLRADNAAVFVGAGMSKAAGFVDWAGLLSPIAVELGLDVRREHDLVGLAQFHLNANAGNRHHLNQLLIDQFSDLRAPSENHRILARLPIRTYWTTNYDRLIEKALEESGKRVDAKYTNEQLSFTRRGRDAIIYKMHGDAENPDKAVLTRDDYERYHLTHAPFIIALSGQLVDTTFLFLGFSFNDPNLDYVLSHVRNNFRQHQRRHYCLTKRRARLDGESHADFDYAWRKQKLVVNDLMRFNITTVFVDGYGEVTEILRVIENRFRRRSVFISGSAADYGPWGRDATEAFLIKLAGRLIEDDYKINSGFGLGIGGAIVSGAVQQIYSSPERSIQEQLLLRPFPLGIQDAQERLTTFTRFRRELIAQAGIALFVMGNKMHDGSIVKADGVRAEFEIAKSQGLYLLPIGASGYMAEDLWKEIMGSFETYFPKHNGALQLLMKKIGEPTTQPTDLLQPIIDLVNLLARE